MDLRPGNEWHAASNSPIDRILPSSEWDRDLIAHSCNLLCVHDLSGRLLSINAASARLLGYDEQEILQKPMRDFLTPQTRPLFDLYLEEIKQKGESYGVMTVVTRKGEHLVWEYHNILHKPDRAEPCVHGIAHDVTARVRAEKTLLETNAKLLRIASEQEASLKELTLSRTLLDQANDAIIVIETTSLRIVEINGRALAFLGYSREELLSMTVTDIAPAVNENERIRVLRCLDETGPMILERQYRRKDGSTFPVEVSLRRASLNREYITAVARDITSRKQTEERLREFGKVVEHLEDLIVVVNRDYKFMLVNRAYLHYRQLKAEEVIGRSVAEVLGQELFATQIRHRLDECFSGRIVTYELRYLYPKLGERDLLITYLPVEDPTGIERVACVMRDITAQKQAEASQKASEARERSRAEELATVLDAVPVPVYISHDPSCRRMTGNRAAYSQLQIDLGANFSKSASPEEIPPFRLFQDGVEVSPDQLPMQRAARTGQSIYDSAQTMILGDGTQRETLVNAVPLFDDQGKPRGAVGASIDLTDLKDAEKALRQSEHRFRAVYEESLIGIALADTRTGRFVQANPKFCEITGRTEGELLELDILRVSHPDDVGSAEDFLPNLGTGKFENLEIDKRYVRPDGSVRWGRVVVIPLSEKEDGRRVHVALVQDITERKQAEDSLRQSEERFRVALKNSPIAVFNQDKDLLYTWSYNSQLPFTPADKIGKSLFEIVNPEEAAQIAEVRRRVLQTGVGERGETQITLEGKKKYFDTTIEPVLNAAGAVIGITGASMDVTELRETSEALREAKRRLTEEKLYLEKEIDTELGFGEIIGQSEALHDVMRQVGRVASSNATVLLLGETGTGKELVARAIHRSSQRHSNSFIKMNCAAIPSGLLESELFGHEKGAFTGAISKKIGRLELADGGTLFLDEIGEIALALQPKLLRVLQDQEFERLGGNQTVKVNFRLIAATNSNLADRIQKNEFRSDLFYRLNVFPICVPPLRERREDIRLLVEHFVDKCARRMNKTITSIPRKTMDALISWDWPGNVRELENFVERSVILTEGSVLVAPLNALQPAQAARLRDQTLESAERDYILRALRESHGKIGGPRGAAMRLGLKRTTLQSKMKHLGIDPQSQHPIH